MMANLMFLCSVVSLLLLSCFILCQGFISRELPSRVRASESSVRRQLFLREIQEGLALSNEGDDSSVNSEGTVQHQLSRRKALGSALTLVSALTLPLAGSAAQKAAPTRDNEQSSPNFDCLLDLPPLSTEDHVRLFVCRHGQTENNRLGLIQGSRINPSINHTGEQQAERLGRALARLSHPPDTVFHSGLERAKETAMIASSVFRDAQTTRELPALREVDFGPVAEGEPVQNFRAKMTSTYASWAMGEVDRRMVEGGESAQEIYTRIDNALATMVAAASQSTTRSVAAVSHSAYLKMLLSTVANTSLVQVAALQQKNCCINVVDIAPDSLGQTVLRINEKRHLVGVA